MNVEQELCWRNYWEMEIGFRRMTPVSLEYFSGGFHPDGSDDRCHLAPVGHGSNRANDTKTAGSAASYFDELQVNGFW